MRTGSIETGKGSDGVPMALHVCLLPLNMAFLVCSFLAGSLIVAIAAVSTFIRKILELVPGVVPMSSTIAQWFHSAVEVVAKICLKDHRDEPILAAIILISITALPVLAFQLYLGEINWYLVIAYYLSVFGPNVRAFNRSFTAMHIGGHKIGGIFKRSSGAEKMFGHQLTYLYFCFFMGIIPHTDAHVHQHHRENVSPLDLYETSEFDHSSFKDFVLFTFRSLFYQQIMLSPAFYFLSKGRTDKIKSILTGNLIFITFFVLLCAFSWKIAVLYFLVPFFASNLLIAIMHWTQHTFYGGQKDPLDYMYNTVTLREKPVNYLNEGYHLIHHHPSRVHWSEIPSFFEDEEFQREIKSAQSIVFNDIGFYDLYFALMLKKFDFLAEKLEWWEPLSHEKRVSMLKFRVKAAQY